jgi:hypothetical protein
VQQVLNAPEEPSERIFVELLITNTVVGFLLAYGNSEDFMVVIVIQQGLVHVKVTMIHRSNASVTHIRAYIGLALESAAYL